ncbi:hypothetical protein LOK74_08315 [Brevibacillus humidisoli]|uniref:hypothetical protein n=1 Tax=Brevibacillus humidisoli TaxID=2895522 RepID=UPI001E4F89DD|nr:hypothetical protein [Brevibacillus humidisoli]UFJ42478.1 hypothetical protein LOK74_08315 [Brevibacillus humidisoli]
MAYQLYSDKNAVLRERIQELADDFGREAVVQTTAKLMGRKPSYDYLDMITPTLLSETIRDLDKATQDLIKAGRSREEAHAEKRDLIRRRIQLEVQIQRKEAEAILAIRGEGKEAHVIVEGEKLYVTNDKARDAYRFRASIAEREQLAAVEAELAALEVRIGQANDIWYALKEASETIRAKANVKAALLTYLASRWIDR